MFKARDSVILAASVLLGLAIVPGALSLWFQQPVASFYRELLGGRSALVAWLLVLGPLLLVESVWAIRRMLRSNSGQKKLLVGAVSLTLLMLFVPPWQAGWSGGRKFLGYSPVIMEPPHFTTESAVYDLERRIKRETPFTDADMVPVSVPGNVAWTILLSQVVVLAIATVAIHYVLGPSGE